MYPKRKKLETFCPISDPMTLFFCCCFLEPVCVLSSCCLWKKRARLLHSQKPWLFPPGLHELEVQGPRGARWSEEFHISPSSESRAGAAGRGHLPLMAVVRKTKATSAVGWGLQTDCGTGHKLYMARQVGPYSCVFSHRRLFRPTTCLSSTGLQQEPCQGTIPALLC